MTKLRRMRVPGSSSSARKSSSSRATPTRRNSKYNNHGNKTSTSWFQQLRGSYILEIVSAIIIVFGIYKHYGDGSTVNLEITLQRQVATPSPLRKVDKPANPTENENHIIDEEKCRLAIKQATDGIVNRKEVGDDELLTKERKANVVELATRVVLQPHLRGDFVEAGTYHGTSSLLAALVQKAAFDNPEVCGNAIRKSRRIWIADSFLNDDSSEDLLQTSITNFQNYGFQTSGGKINFLKGFFDDTLEQAPIESIALLRIDGDQHPTSTVQALKALYSKVVIGGYVIVSIFAADPYTNTRKGDCDIFYLLHILIRLTLCLPRCFVCA